MLAAGRRDPRVAVAGSLLLYPDTREVQHAGIDFTFDGIPYHRFRFCPFETQGVDVSGIVRAVTGACFLTQRDLFGRLGGFDEGFVNGYEDVDFCLRAAAAGGLSYYCSDSVLLHHESGTPGRIDRRREAANLDYLLRRWRNRVPPLSRRPGLGDKTESAW
jgi:GT2 family glycosyltransferase